MKFHLFLRPESQADVSKAFHWYEKQMHGLGHRFLASIEKALHSIQAHPARFPQIHKNVCRSLLRQFPYAIFLFEKGIPLSLWRYFIRRAIHFIGKSGMLGG